MTTSWDSSLCLGNGNEREVISGEEAEAACIARSAEVLEAAGLPGGLLPLKDIQECGFDKTTGLVWIKQKRQSQHYFKRAGRLVSFDREVRAYLEHRRLRNVSGVKAKEYLVWAPVGDITVEGEGESESESGPSDQEIIRFRSYGGISRTFPAIAFSRKE
uniref:TSA: Wollemia nobilis Ref_Wollemi_Transcript_15397_571 transcribed RNA sequence n=1 Tax=Wollemia nobilis TaxID=56998 RepID=A0A0C9S3A6_9CONI